MKQSYVAIGRKVPYVGSSQSLWRFESDLGHFFPVSLLTSTVEIVEQMAENLFRVETRNSVYYVQVITAICTNMYVAFSNDRPETGRRMRCMVLKDLGKGLEVVTIHTSVIRKVEELGSIFRVDTKNSIYYVKIAK